MHAAATVATAALLAAPLVKAASYPVVESFAGSQFLDGWVYPNSPYDNTTSGDVFWANPSNTSLIYVNDAGRVVLKVDNTSFVPYNEKRYAPKILTKNAYPDGTVWVLDATHLPYGCSVWPAFWTSGPKWPAGGEIDIIEGINKQTTNQIALHTQADGCTLPQSAQADMSGTIGLTNCSIGSNWGSGCTVSDKNENSYGAAFATAGGGVFVTEYTKEFVKVWFFTRPSVPSALTASASSIDTGSLGTPVAYYPATSCGGDLTKFFGPQTLILDTTLCGAWAGGESQIAECGLTGTNTCYTQYVINDASATYQNAYWEINYINIFSTGKAVAGTDGGAQASFGSNSNTSAGDAAASSAGVKPSGGSSGSSPSSSSKPAGARRNLDVGLGRLGWGAAVTAGVAAGIALVL